MTMNNRELYKTCAVVGAAPTIMNSEWGEDIDKHECVIRCNRSAVAGYEKNVGSRTDIRVINCHISCTLANPNHNKEVLEEKFEKWSTISCSDVIGPTETIFLKDNFPQELQGVDSLRTNEIYRVPDWILQYTSSLGVPSLTSGFCAIMIASRLSESVNCYGFDFFKNNDYNHYYENVNQTDHCHGIDREVSVINQLSNVKFIRG